MLSLSWKTANTASCYCYQSVCANPAVSNRMWSYVRIHVFHNDYGIALLRKTQFERGKCDNLRPTCLVSVKAPQFSHYNDFACRCNIYLVIFSDSLCCKPRLMVYVSFPPCKSLMISTGRCVQVCRRWSLYPVYRSRDFKNKAWRTNKSRKVRARLSCGHSVVR